MEDVGVLKNKVNNLSRSLELISTEFIETVIETQNIVKEARNAVTQVMDRLEKSEVDPHVLQQLGTVKTSLTNIGLKHKKREGHLERHSLLELLTKSISSRIHFNPNISFDLTTDMSDWSYMVFINLLGFYKAVDKLLDIAIKDIGEEKGSINIHLFCTGKEHGFNLHYQTSQKISEQKNENETKWQNFEKAMDLLSSWDGDLKVNLLDSNKVLIKILLPSA